jgi:threonylcarbamoyladenosine tRNA methylthiotransferase MtaB
MSKPVNMKKNRFRKSAMVQVLGCKVNQAEAAAMAKILEDKGYCVDSDAQDPTLIVINTCCVTSKAEAKSRRMANRLANKFPKASLVITGCLAEINPSSLDGLSGDRILLGTFEKDHFADFIGKPLSGSDRIVRRGAARSTVFGDLGGARTTGRSRVFLKVQDGCSQGCTYCIVPKARGPSRSLPLDGAVERARTMEASGFAEIVVTGVHLGVYGRDLTPLLGLEDLLGRLLEACPVTRFRLSSVEPQEISPRLIALMASHPRMCRHLHIPLQSGDDEILGRMGRPYDTGMILDLVERVAGHSPETCIGMDVMVGFPGEDEQSFRRTLALIEEIEPAYLHVFPFSPRPGTSAASLGPQIPEQIARQRVEELRSLSRSLRTAFCRRFLGKTLWVVLENRSDQSHETATVRSDNYLAIRVARADLPPGKKTFAVRLEKMLGSDAWGMVCDDA